MWGECSLYIQCSHSEWIWNMWPAEHFKKTKHLQDFVILWFMNREILFDRSSIYMYWLEARHPSCFTVNRCPLFSCSEIQMVQHLARSLIHFKSSLFTKQLSQSCITRSLRRFVVRARVWSVSWFCSWSWEYGLQLELESGDELVEIYKQKLARLCSL